MKGRLGESHSEDEHQSVEDEQNCAIVDVVVESFLTKQVEELKEQIAGLTDVKRV